MVGVFKGLVRVMEHEKDRAPYEDTIKDLFHPKGYKIRLYALRAVGLGMLARLVAIVWL